MASWCVIAASFTRSEAAIGPMIKKQLAYSMAIAIVYVASSANPWQSNSFAIAVGGFASATIALVLSRTLIIELNAARRAALM